MGLNYLSKHYSKKYGSSFDVLGLKRVISVELLDHFVGKLWNLVPKSFRKLDFQFLLFTFQTFMSSLKIQFICAF